MDHDLHSPWLLTSNHKKFPAHSEAGFHQMLNLNSLTPFNPMQLDENDNATRGDNF